MFAVLLMLVCGDIRPASMAYESPAVSPPRVVITIQRQDNTEATLVGWFEKGHYWYWPDENPSYQRYLGSSVFTRIVGLGGAAATGDVGAARKHAAWETQGVVKQRMDQPRESVLRVRAGEGSEIEPVGKVAPTPSPAQTFTIWSGVAAGILAGWLIARLLLHKGKGA